MDFIAVERSIIVTQTEPVRNTQRGASPTPSLRDQGAHRPRVPDPGDLQAPSSLRSTAGLVQMGTYDIEKLRMKEKLRGKTMNK